MKSKQNFKLKNTNKEVRKSEKRSKKRKTVNGMKMILIEPSLWQRRMEKQGLDKNDCTKLITTEML